MNNNQTNEELVNVEEKSSKKNKKKMNPKKVKLIKIIGGCVGFVLLIAFIIFVARPTKYVSCVTFLGNDISVYYKNGELVLPSGDEIKRVGYSFEGWYTTDKFVEEYDPETFSGKRLYAKYERIVYTIEYEGDFSFGDETMTPNGIQVWNPETFFVKYNDKIVSDEAATAAWKTLVGSETDRVATLFIANPTSGNLRFDGWEVYLNTDEDRANRLTTLKVDPEGYCRLSKDIIIDYDDVDGIVLVPIWL